MRRLVLLAKRSAKEYSADNCSQMAAAVSYYVLFSLFPLMLFLVSIFGLVIHDRERQEEIADEIIVALGFQQGNITLEPDASAITGRYGPQGPAELQSALDSLTTTELEGLADRLREGESIVVDGRVYTRDEISVRSGNLVIDTLRGLSQASGALTLIGILGTFWSASSMFGAIRKALNAAWDIERQRPVVQQKLLDLGMVSGFGVLLLISVGGTTALRTLRELSDDALGPLSTGASLFWEALPFILPAVFSFGLFALLYMIVPATTVRFLDAWPGALVATILFEIFKNAFGFYVANFNNYDAAYGTLGGIMLFLFWVYVSANVMLVGAEVASEYPRVMQGAYDSEPPAVQPALSRREKIANALKGLFVSSEPPRR